MTSSYMAVLACYGRPPLSRVGVSEECIEPSISSNTFWYAHFLPLMRRTAEPRSLSARSARSLSSRAVSPARLASKNVGVLKESLV